jgi:hypothetical protein
MPLNPLRPRTGNSALPGPIRAALGVVASVVDDRQKLADRALELPVLAVSTALQMSLRAQQRYAALTAKGDDFLSQLRGAPDAPPEWARFDDDNEVQADTDAAPAKTVPTTTAATKTPARKTAPAKTVPAKTVPAKTVPAKTVPAKTGAGKVNPPRKRKPSAFDQVGEDADLPDLQGFSIPSSHED